MVVWIGSDVEIVGEVSGADKDVFLRDAAALLFPIRWPEPFPNGTGHPADAHPVSPVLIQDIRDWRKTRLQTSEGPSNRAKAVGQFVQPHVEIGGPSSDKFLAGGREPSNNGG